MAKSTRKPTSSNSLNLAELLTSCPMQHAMQRLSGRYKVGLLWHVHRGVHRFGLLRKALPTATTKMLTQQLRELEADGLLTRTVFAEMPPRVEYALTARAGALLEVLNGLHAWGERLKQEALEQARLLATPA